MTCEAVYKEPRDTLCLPYELERKIFDLAAQTCPGSAPKLALVSSYVREWMEAFIYGILVLDLPFNSIQLFLRTFYTRPHTFFATTVKRLYITSVLPVDDAQKIISACTGAHSVACWTDAIPTFEGLYRFLPSHTLQRLSIKIETIWRYTSGHTTHRFLPKHFPHLTHLEIVNPPGQNVNATFDGEGIYNLPSLTHLAIGDLWQPDHLYMIKEINTILQNCPNLQLLAIMTPDVNFVSQLQAEMTYNDPRLIVLPNFHWPGTIREFWAAVRRGESDVWDNAENLCKARVGTKAPRPIPSSSLRSQMH